MEVDTGASVSIISESTFFRLWPKTGVHNAKAEECTTPYMCQNIKINIGVGGLHGNQGY